MLSREALAKLLDYEWPGNVRELDNVIQRALIIQDGNVISAGSLALDMQAGQASGVSLSANQTGVVTDIMSAQATMQSADDEGLLADADEGVLGNDLKQREFEIILKTLRQQGGRRKETAEVLGVSARTLRYKMARMRDSGINIESMLKVS